MIMTPFLAHAISTIKLYHHLCNGTFESDEADLIREHAVGLWHQLTAEERRKLDELSAKLRVQKPYKEEVSDLNKNEIAVYISYARGPISHSDDLIPGHLTVDYTKDGQLAGIELLRVSRLYYDRPYHDQCQTK